MMQLDEFLVSHDLSSCSISRHPSHDYMEVKKIEDRKQKRKDAVRACVENLPFVSNNEPQQLPIRVSVEELSKIHLNHIPIGRKALQYYNQKEASNFEFSRILAVRWDSNITSNVHINFTARSSSYALEELFFASVELGSSVKPVHMSDILVHGCCRLVKVGDPNSCGALCCMCYDSLIHPGPRSGYEAVAGDKFENKNFHKLCDHVISQHLDMWINYDDAEYELSAKAGEQELMDWKNWKIRTQELPRQSDVYDL